MGVGAEVLDIEGTSSEQLKAAADLKSIHAFVASDPSRVTSAQLLFENLALTIGGTKLSETEYLDQLVDILLQQKDYNYELVEENSVEIATKTFQHVKVSLFGGVMYQEYYSYKKDKFMASIIVNYTPEQENLKVDFINNISTLD